MPVIRAYHGAVVPSPQAVEHGRGWELNKSAGGPELPFRCPGPSCPVRTTPRWRASSMPPRRGTRSTIHITSSLKLLIKNGQFTFAQYKAAWTHIVAIADAAHNPYLHSTLILQHQDARPGDQVQLQELPASQRSYQHSRLGCDPNGTGDDWDPQPTPPAQFMGPAVAASKSVGLPFGFAEFASAHPPTARSG